MIRIIAGALLFLSFASPAVARPAPVLGSGQFDCDALSISQRLNKATLRDLGPAHSLEAAAAVLAKHKVKFVRLQGLLSIGGMPERTLRDITTLPQGEPIILPNGEGSAICVLRPSADSI